jgi:hypothetical protein
MHYSYRRTDNSLRNDDYAQSGIVMVALKIEDRTRILQRRIAATYDKIIQTKLGYITEDI